MTSTYGTNLLCPGADIRIVPATKKIREICGTLEQESKTPPKI